MAAPISRGMSSQAGPLRRRATQLAQMAPRMICPSTPMFHRPAVKVTSRPTEQSTSGIQKATTLRNLSDVPKAPSHMAR